MSDDYPYLRSAGDNDEAKTRGEYRLLAVPPELRRIAPAPPPKHPTKILYREYAIMQRKLATELMIARAQALADASIEAAFAVQRAEISFLKGKLKRQTEFSAPQLASAITGVGLQFLLTPVGKLITKSITSYLRDVLNAKAESPGAVAKWLYKNAAEQIKSGVKSKTEQVVEFAKEQVARKEKREVSQLVSELVAVANRKRRGIQLLFNWQQTIFEWNVHRGAADDQIQNPVNVADLDATEQELAEWEAQLRTVQEATMWALLYGFVHNARHLDPKGQWVVGNSEGGEPLLEEPDEAEEEYWAKRFGSLIQSFTTDTATGKAWERLMSDLSNPDATADLYGFPTEGDMKRVPDQAKIRRRVLLDDFFSPLGKAANEAMTSN